MDNDNVKNQTQQVIEQLWKEKNRIAKDKTSIWITKYLSFKSIYQLKK
jgi:hypothetical protein